MKSHRNLAFILIAAWALTLACALFNGGAQPTEEPEDYIFPDYGPLGIEPAEMPAGKVGEAYDVEIRITQNETPAGDMFISTGALPPGLEWTFLEGEDKAQISGIPAGAGNFKFTVYVWCYGTMVSGQTIEKEYEIVVGQ